MPITAHMKKINKTRFPKWKHRYETTLGIAKYEFTDSTGTDYENVISMDASERAFALEEQSFHEMSELDKQNYRGKFVAMYGQKVVDSDDNESELIGRFFKKYGNVRVYIDKVEDIESEIEVLSPYYVD